MCPCYLHNKDNKDTFFVVFDGLISILQLLHNGMENAKTTSGSCDRASLTQEKKEPTDDTSKDVYSLLAQHVSGIIMPIVRRTD